MRGLVLLIGMLGGFSPYTPVIPAPDWMIIALPDTQHYAQDYPDHFYAVADWVADQRPDLVLHVGDVVDEDEPEQWAVADKAFKALDSAGIPYILSIGNHDYTYDGSRNSSYSEVFPVSRMNLQTFEPGETENGWRTVLLGDQRWLILSVELFPRSDVLTWAIDVLNAHSDFPTIIVTHAFLNTDGLRYGEDPAIDHWYGPNNLQGSTGTCATVGCPNDADTMYRHLVEPYSQVKLVLSGHVLTGPAARWDIRSDGTMAWQVVQNYQEQGEGGDGYIRIYEGYGQYVTARTFSPITGQELTGEQHRFVMNLR